MSDLIHQFFGDAKRLTLSSKEKAAAWDSISTRVSARSIALSSREKADAFAAIQAHMVRNPIKQPAQFYSRFFSLQRFTAMAMVVLLLVGAGGTATYAAESAMPDDILYPVKIHVNEPIRGALRFDPEDRASWEAERIERRLREAEHLSSSEGLTETRRTFLQERLQERMEEIETRLEHVPEEVREKIRDRIDQELERHEEFLEKVQDGTATPEDVHAFKEQMHTLRDTARTRWGREGLPPRPPRRDVMNTLKERNEELRLPARENLQENEVKNSLPSVESPAEGWLSGRKRTTRNRVDGQPSRGFESPSLRQEEINIPDRMDAPERKENSTFRSPVNPFMNFDLQPNRRIDDSSNRNIGPLRGGELYPQPLQPRL